MSAHASPNIITDGLAFMYDTGSGKSYKGQPTANLINQMIGTTTISYPENVYISTATETNVADSSAPGGQYSRFTGNTDSSNNQLYSRFNTASIDVRNTTITYSVYLKGSGTCHLTIYADNSGYGTSSTITLTNEWTHYTYTRSVTNYTTNCWVAVRGILTTTDVYIAAQQAEIKSHATQFVNGTRSATEGLIDRTNTATIDLSNTSFDSDAQITLDGTDDYIDLGSDVSISPDNQGWTTEYWFNTNSASTLQHFNSAENDEFNANWLAILSSKLAVWNRSPGYWKYGDTIIQLNTWYQAVFICDAGGTNMRFYVNGEAEGGNHVGNVWTASYSSLDVRYIGKYEYQGGHSRYFNGEINAVKIYDRALTDEEVLQNYNATKSRFGL